MNREPIATVGGITAAVTAILAVLLSFGVDLTPDQQTAIIGVVPFIVAAVTWVAARQWTTPWKDTIAVVTPSGEVVPGPAGGDYVPKHEAPQ